MNFKYIVQRELLSYFTTPIAYVFIVVFLLLNGFLSFYFGQFFERGQADLISFFSFHPWIYMIFIPAITMRLWAEERKLGTIELMFTQPVSSFDLVLGKFIAGLLFVASSLFLTFPWVIALNYLGSPDNGIIATSYVASLLLAGSYLAIGLFVSGLSKNQVIAFIVSVFINFFINIIGYSTVMKGFLSWTPKMLDKLILQLSFINNFDVLIKGIIAIPNVIYFFSVICVFLYLNTLTIFVKKAS